MRGTTARHDSIMNSRNISDVIQAKNPQRDFKMIMYTSNFEIYK